MSAMTIPNLFIVGAMKSGTSTVHSALGTHPEIFMCEPKEPSYFVDHADLKELWPEMARLDISWKRKAYLDLFREARGARIVGESSTCYAKSPHAPGVAGRIAAFNPEAKILFILRNPLERTISHYWHAVKREGEARDIYDAITSSRIYVDVSNYAMQIGEYLKHFDEERLKVVTLEEYSAAPGEMYSKLCEWLGVCQSFTPQALGAKHHVTPEVIRQSRPLGAASEIYRAPLYQKIKPVIPGKVRKFFQDILRPEVDRRSVDQQRVKEYLQDIQASQIKELSRLLGRGFPEWQK